MSKTRPAHAIVPLIAALALLCFTLTAALPAIAQNATPASGTAASGQEMTIPQVVKQVGPAVVTVINEQQSTNPNTAQNQIVPAGSGTGFIIDNDGHIVTNDHVVEGGQKFQVVYADGSTHDATVVGADPVSDIAVIQVKGKVPATLQFGDSSTLVVGQTVIAIGSPLGSFTSTVTSGIVSALNRDFPNDPYYTNLIQHDAAINPGNSGGPLLDLNGNVVGVNTLGIPEENGQPVQGLFFAIPSNTVKTIAQTLISQGSVTYPFMGVGIVPITPDLVAQYNLPVNQGVIVTDVPSGGPADDAGIEQGDLITAIDGVKIDEQNTFTEVLFMHKPGDKVKVDIVRGNDKKTVTVTLSKRQQGQ
jgi:2-alkenal reductase